MTQFVVNATRFDPYKNFKFRVRWDGRYVAGISHVSALRLSTEVIEHREGGDGNSARKSPGQTTYAPIVLSRGVSHDRAFEEWASLTHRGGGASAGGVSLRDFRKDIVLEFCNEAGQLAIAYRVHRCWVSDYVALPELDANANAIAIQTLTLQNEGWERDTDLAEPMETATPATA